MIFREASRAAARDPPLNDLRILMKNHELWLTRVFHHDAIAGNLTPVLVCQRDIPAATCLQIANRLGMSDTAFLFLYENITPFLLSFTPFEELKFCTQTLLAAAGILHTLSGQSHYEITTRVGTMQMSGGKQNIWSIRTQLPMLQPTPDFASTLNHFNLDVEDLAGPLYVTGIGRSRLYIPLKSVASLNHLQLSRQQILTLCHQQKLNGICFFVVNDRNQINQRVFTTSLDGAEDVATGGAALGLLIYSELKEKYERAIVVQQGHIDSIHRGQLYIRLSTHAGFGEVGGKVAIIAKGSLC